MLCKKHFLQKKYSVLIVVGKWLLPYLGLKLALESANVTSKVWPFGLFAPFFPGGHCGVTLENSFFRVPTNLWSTYKIQASRFEELSGAGTVRVRGQMKNELVDEKYESFESFLSCHPLSPRERWGGKREQFSGISTWMIDGGNNFIQQLVKNKYLLSIFRLYSKDFQNSNSVRLG